MLLIVVTVHSHISLKVQLNTDWTQCDVIELWRLKAINKCYFIYLLKQTIISLFEETDSFCFLYLFFLCFDHPSSLCFYFLRLFTYMTKPNKMKQNDTNKRKNKPNKIQTCLCSWFSIDIGPINKQRVLG